MIAHGWAFWTILNVAIRFRENPEVLQERRIKREMERDRQYWASVARERDGAEVYFEWRAGKVRVPGSESWSRKLGYSVMEGRAVVRG